MLLRISACTGCFDKIGVIFHFFEAQIDDFSLWEVFRRHDLAVGSQSILGLILV